MSALFIFINMFLFSLRCVNLNVLVESKLKVSLLLSNYIFVFVNAFYGF